MWSVKNFTISAESIEFEQISEEIIMAASERLTGKNLVVEWIHSGGTAVVSGDQTTFDVTRDSEEADATAADDGGTFMKFLRQVNGATLAALFTGTAGSASIGSATVRGAEGTVLYGVNGTVAGQPKGGFPATIKSAGLAHPYDGMVTLDIEWSPQGAELFNPAVDVWP